ncbi:MAG: transcriptional activator NhaR [Candidatus Polarisedimenticolaceae bacterium]|nr:transcriptional activator NhaR [Candidatus Polarisedimenticolaceae bacterium]
MNINYKHLHYFWAVAKEGSIARASERLHLTPQTISAQISLLEESIGVKLFERAGRGLQLSEAGQTTLSYADEIFQLGSELKEVLQGHPSGRPLQLNVGITEALPKLIAYRLLEPALQLPDPPQLVCREDRLNNLLADIAVHKLDMILSDSPMPPGMNVRAFNHFLGKCGVSFFATKGQATRYRANFPHSLDGAPMLVPSNDTALRGTLMQWFEQTAITPRIVGEFDDSALMKVFGQAGVGIFSAPTVIEQEVQQQYHVEAIGRTTEIHERFYAISAERKLKHPAVVAVSHAAHHEIFSND